MATRSQCNGLPSSARLEANNRQVQFLLWSAFCCFRISQRSRSGQSAASQAEISSRRQRIAPPIRTGRGSFPALSSRRTVRSDRPSNSASRFASIAIALSVCSTTLFEASLNSWRHSSRPGRAAGSGTQRRPGQAAYILPPAGARLLVAGHLGRQHASEERSAQTRFIFITPRSIIPHYPQTNCAVTR